jgi:adenylate cyclase
VTEPFQVRILVNGKPASDTPLAGPLELGRQQAGEPEVYTLLPPRGTAPARLLIARQEERDNVSRHHALLEPLPSGRVRVRNSSQAPLSCPAAPGGLIAPGAAAELAPAFFLHLPGRTVSVAPPGSEAPAEPAGLHSLDQPTVAPSRLADLSGRLRSLPALAAPQLDELVGWLQTTMGVLQAAIGAADFLHKAAEALVQIVGLDHGRVLLLDGDGWTTAAAHGAGPEDTRQRPPSRHVLAQVRENRKTFWLSQGQPRGAETPSLEPLERVVAAPVLDSEGGVIGALYGERRQADPSPLHVGGKVEAMLVELLACGVAAGLARQAQEKAALAARVRFEQFFGPDLARLVTEDPRLLESRDARVTVLFCDVRNFSGLSEKLGPAETVRWMNELLSELSRQVLAEQGVLVDYIADELVAMWGAPQEQPDQSARAVRAGLAMLASLPAVSRRWQAALGGPVEVGIGVNSGPARVGITGSEFKFKYGPLGNTVNLASRVQGLTKYLKCRLLVTGETREGLGEGLLARRVVRARVVNIERPVDLYEVAEADSEYRRQFFAESEVALSALESGDFALAARKAGTLLLDHKGDGPLLLTLSRASSALMRDGQGFDPVWEPPGK